MASTAEVYGVRETLRELRELDRKVALGAQASMRKAAGPLVAAVNAFVPTSAPLSGFEHNGRTGWGKAKKFRAKSGGRYNRRSNTWPLLQIRNDSAPVQIFDMASSGDLGSALTGRWGPASRAAWRPGDELRQEAAAAVLAACEEAARKASVAMAYTSEGF